MPPSVESPHERAHTESPIQSDTNLYKEITVELKHFDEGEKLKVALCTKGMGVMELWTYESEEEVVKRFLPNYNTWIVGVNDAMGEVHHYFRLNDKDCDTLFVTITPAKVRQIVPPTVKVGTSHRGLVRP